MHKLVSQLVIYRNLPTDNFLEPLAEICAEFAAGDYNREELTAEIYEQVHKLLDIGTVYGFDKNLWHNYLAFLLVSCENPFAITCERLVPAMAALISLPSMTSKFFSSCLLMISASWSVRWRLTAFR